MAQAQSKLLKRRIAGAYVSSVISISLVLLLTGFAAMLLINAGRVGDYFRESVHLTVLLKPGATEAQAARFQRDAEREPFVLGTKVIGVEQGTQELKEMLGEDFLNVFAATPVPVSVEVTLQPEWLESSKLDMVISKLQAYPNVDEVSCQRSLVEAMTANLRKISLALTVLTLVMLFISVVLIANTVRLNIFSHRFTIHTMQLVGATRRFIIRPYIHSAIFQGLFAGLISMAILLALMYLIRRSFARIFDIFSVEVLAEVLSIMLVAGVAICVLSTYFIVRKLATMSKDELYG